MLPLPHMEQVQIFRGRIGEEGIVKMIGFHLNCLQWDFITLLKVGFKSNTNRTPNV